jgi:knotted carbamoyltransferase YgeW
MMDSKLVERLEKIKQRKTNLYNADFLLTWEKGIEDLEQILDVALALKHLRERNISVKVFDSGLAVSNFRDNSTRTRFSFASAANLLGLTVQDLDEVKSQIAHGETVRETAAMISFMTEFIGIRDDIFLGEGDKYQREVADALTDSYQTGVLNQRPGIINLQSDLDHPTQSMADLLHLYEQYSSLKALKGKKIAMTWAYSPSYGKPLSVPQGIIALMPRFGIDVSLAYPSGYDLIPEVVERSKEFAKESGSKFEVVNSMEEAFQGADFVYPKSWAPFHIMEKRTEILKRGDKEALKMLEKECLAENAKHKSWECTEEMMQLTNKGEALYMHCLPADITGVSCENGEVSASVFDKYRIPLYKQAGYKPYIIAAMMLVNKYENPENILRHLHLEDNPRKW